MFTNADFTHFDLPPLSDADVLDLDLSDDKAGTGLKYEDLLAGKTKFGFMLAEKIDSLAHTQIRRCPFIRPILKSNPPLLPMGSFPRNHKWFLYQTLQLLHLP